MTRTFCYNFPENKRAKNATTMQQLLKCREELFEAMDAAFGISNDNPLDEIMDLLCATENAIRKYPEAIVNEAYKHCLLKGCERNDWI